MSPVPQSTSMTLPLAVHRTSASYAIMWDQIEEVIAPKVMYGSNGFVQMCKLCEFKPGQDWVGKLYNGSQGQATVLWDSLVVDPRSFHRKHAAVINGISSIIFLKARDGSLLELGFESCDDAEASLSQLNNLENESESTRDSERSDSESTSGSQTSSTPSSRRVSESTLAPMNRRAWTDDDVPLFHRRSGSSADEEDAPEIDIPEVACVPCEESPSIGLSWPSVGSRGHPTECGQVCKFAWRQRGCKDGAACTRCHICRFTRKAAKTFKNQQEERQQAVQG